MYVQYGVQFWRHQAGILALWYSTHDTSTMQTLVGVARNTSNSNSRATHHNLSYPHPTSNSPPPLQYYVLQRSDQFTDYKVLENRNQPEKNLELNGGTCPPTLKTHCTP